MTAVSGRSVKKLIVICLFLAFLLSTTACTPQAYEGGRRDLYTVAAYSVAGYQGMGAGIEVVETDSCGRVLFLYTAKDIGFFGDAEKDTVKAYVICQRSNNRYAYFYADDCFELFKDEPDEERINELKERNGWDGKPDNDGLSARAILPRISSKFHYTAADGKESTPIDISSKFYEILPDIKKYYKLKFDDAVGELFDLDVNGWELYYFRAINLKNGESHIGALISGDEIEYVASYFLLKKEGALDGSAALVQIDDPYNYRNDLKQLKRSVGFKSVAEIEPADEAKIFGIIDELDALSEYAKDEPEDKNIEDIRASESFRARVEYEGSIHTVFAYAFPDADGAREYYYRVTGKTVNARNYDYTENVSLAGASYIAFYQNKVLFISSKDEDSYYKLKDFLFDMITVTLEK